MFEINEVKISRILNPTLIDLGEYVINPYMGCEYSCLYCYVRSNRVVSKKNKRWGEFLDIRINAPELLEKELLIKKPKTILLGSTTECFQPIESKYFITRKILEILNANGVYYVILTRSPYIVNYIYLLKKGFCKNIYFTINNYPDILKNKLEPKSPEFKTRLEAVNQFLKEGIPVVPYFSPILPWISNIKEIITEIKQPGLIEFECLNFRLKNFTEIMDKIGETDVSIKEKYKKMSLDKMYYDKVWDEIKEIISDHCNASNMKYNIYTHAFGNYFENKYIK